MEETTQKQNPYLMPGAIVAAGLIIAGAVILSQKAAIQPPGADSGLPEEEQLAPRDINIELEGWATLGSPEAPVLMVEYSDFACPFCTRFWQETLPLIKRDYIDTGKVRMVYKDFIVVGGDRGAEAAHCAQEQGKFWEYHDLLFSRNAQDRSQWSDSSVHRGYGEELALDSDALVECFESRRYQEKVALSTQEATRNGGTGTPYFLINKKPISGAQQYSVFQEIFEEQLKEVK